MALERDSVTGELTHVYGDQMKRERERKRRFEAQLTREEILDLATKHHDDEQRRIELLSAIAKFQIGDEVRHVDSPKEPINRCVIEDLYVAGFPDSVLPSGEVAYLIVGPGAEGVGLDEVWVVGAGDLIPYEQEER